jgi:phage shock protein PspC (stress-responsive transcriptional regulator)
MEQDDMKRCPYCAELIRREAVKCRFCGSMLNEKKASFDFLSTPGYWRRVNEGKKVAGVCTGIAEQLDAPILILPLRLFFILTTIFYGFGLILYIILWALMAPPSSGIGNAGTGVGGTKPGTGGTGTGSSGTGTGTGGTNAGNGGTGAGSGGIDWSFQQPKKAASDTDFDYVEGSTPREPEKAPKPTPEGDSGNGNTVQRVIVPVVLLLGIAAILGMKGYVSLMHLVTNTISLNQIVVCTALIAATALIMRKSQTESPVTA